MATASIAPSIAQQAGGSVQPATGVRVNDQPLVVVIPTPDETANFRRSLLTARLVA
jgi:hypothetical protein